MSDRETERRMLLIAQTNLFAKQDMKEYNVVRDSYRGEITMSELLTEITAVSSKGQVVIPKTIRDNLNIVPGTKIMVFSDGENVLLKPIPKISVEEFERLMNESAAWAKSVGLTEVDVDKAIKKARAELKAKRESGN